MQGQGQGLDPQGPGQGLHIFSLQGLYFLQLISSTCSSTYNQNQ